MGKLALIFPGQGSQAAGMGEDLARRFKEAADVYLEASEALGWDVGALCFGGPQERLNRTEYAQPALYANSMAAMAVLELRGASADLVCGHSLGEYSALAAAGAVSFGDGLRLVAERGRAMSEAAAARPGAMAAIIGLEDGQVETLCSGAGDVWPVNYNSPGQLVVSGEVEAVRRVMGLAGEAGARRVVELPVTGAFHSPHMQAAAGAMKVLLEDMVFREPDPPFLSTTSCEYEGAGGLAGLLERQIVSPVRWRQAVEKMIADGVDRFVEVGSGRVLCGLIRRIDKGVTALNVSDAASLDKAARVL